VRLKAVRESEATMIVDQQSASEQTSDASEAPDDQDRLLYNPWVVLGLLFLVTMFLGLPLLWLSPRFSKFAKIIITLLNLAYSALVLWAFYLLMAWCYARISGALRDF
jgi:hypothetical protein